jgi:tagaturonate reductase
MNYLSQENTKSLNINNLPEKILQFGTGILLRGLPDFFINKANQQGIFQGRIVVIKSTSDNTEEFDRQSQLFTTFVRGIENNKIIESQTINSAISRTLSAVSHWEEILKISQSSDLQIVISNTTEVGLQYVEESIFQHPPQSFPAKLLAILHARWQAQGEGLIVIPTELIPDNGKLLKAIVDKLLVFNNLEIEFKNWLDTKIQFCSSLVDRIVTQATPELKDSLPYVDDLAIQTEPYCLWAIEGDEKVKKILSFAPAHEGVIIAEDITLYRELKLRLLNGTHTFCSGLAYLAGFNLVKEAMQDAVFQQFINKLMFGDIAKGIPCEIEESLKKSFGTQVLERFANPYTEHLWLNITFQYTSKMRMRNIPILLKYYKKHGTAPESIAFSFAAYLCFMRPEIEINGVFYGKNQAVDYPIKDDSAAYYFDIWQKYKTAEVPSKVLSNQALWGYDLTQLPDFTAKVSAYLLDFVLVGAKEMLAKFTQKEH